MAVAAVRLSAVAPHVGAWIETTAAKIQLDGELYYNYLWGGNIDWTRFEIRNPKDLYCMDGSKYDGDNPKLIELFRYLRTSNKEVAENCEWEHIRKIQKKFEEVKEIEGKEGNYMACDKALEDARYYSKIGGKKKVKSKEKLKMSKT